MQDNNKILKIIIPVVLIVVIIEVLVLTKDLKAKKASVEVSKNKTEEVAVVPVVDLKFATDSELMNVGSKYGVELMMSLRESKNLDSISSYIKYDKTAFEVSNLSFDSKLPTATFAKISSDNGLIVGTFMITEASGMKVETSDEMVIAKFDVIPTKEGEFTFEVDTGNLTKESVTMIIDTASKRPLPFVSNKLKITTKNK